MTFMANPTPKTAQNLALAVAGFMQRDPSTFIRVVGASTWDVLLQALNNARLYAERLIDFEYSKFSIQVDNLTIAGGGNLDNAVLFGTTTPVSVKKVISPFLPIDSSAGQFPVDLATRKSWTDRIKRRFEGAKPTDTTDYAYITDSPFQLTQQGKQVEVSPPDANAFGSATFSVYADAVIWLPDYTSALTETDFLLQFCFDWLMYRSIQELNFFVKEDERVQLSAKFVQDSWAAVIQWNSELVQSSADDIANLD